MPAPLLRALSGLAVALAFALASSLAAGPASAAATLADSVDGWSFSGTQGSGQDGPGCLEEQPRCR